MFSQWNTSWSILSQKSRIVPRQGDYSCALQNDERGAIIACGHRKSEAGDGLVVEKM